jgi:cytoskeleton protein RodZ
MMSSVMERDDALSFAPKAGSDLRAARERIGWTLQQIADALRIRLQYLEALEDGRIGDLPGNAYALGFLRTYANTLGLDPNEIARRFKAEASGVNQKTELAFPVPVPDRGVPAGAAVLLGVILAIGAYAGWYRLSGEGKLPAETATQIPVRLAPLVQQAVPPAVPPPQPAGPAQTAPTLAAPTQTVPTQAAPSAAAPLVVLPSSRLADTEPVQPEDAPPVPAISPSSAAAAVPSPAMVVSPDQSRITLRANADSWVQVRDRGGQVLLNRVLHPGETWDVPARSNLLLTTGNAGGTDLLVDGVSGASLGGYGMVRRDLPLDPDLIKDGKLATSQPIAGVIPQASPRSTPQ